MAKLDEREFDGTPKQLEGESYIDYYNRQDKILNDLWEQTMNLPEGDVKGAVIRFQIADGYAYYLVTKLRPLTVMHLPFGDNWQIPAAHIRGLKKADIVQQVEMEKRMNALFSKKK